MRPSIPLDGTLRSPNARSVPKSKPSKIPPPCCPVPFRPPDGRSICCGVAAASPNELNPLTFVGPVRLEEDEAMFDVGFGEGGEAAELKSKTSLPGKKIGSSPSSWWRSPKEDWVWRKSSEEKVKSPDGREGGSFGGTKEFESVVGCFGLEEFGLEHELLEESGVSGKTGARFSGKKGAGAGEGECRRRTGRIQAGETLAYSGT
jgi:hypothetical protein